MGSLKEKERTDEIDVNSYILGFSGPISSGKTTLSSELFNILKWKKIGFGEYVKKVALERNIEQTREQLQNLGATLIEEQGWEQFCRNVLNMANWNHGDSLIVDGVRHIQVLNALKTITTPSKFLLVYVDIGMEKREERLKDQGLLKDDLSKIDSHSTEIQVHLDLKKHADIVIDGNLPVEESIKKILKYVK